MEKIAGRLYVSTLIISAIARSYVDAIEGNALLWLFVFTHVGCLFFVVKDGVK